MPKDRVGNIDACRRYRLKNRQRARDRTRDAMKVYRHENAEAELARYRERYARNPQAVRESVYAWQAANPEKRRQYGRNRAQRVLVRTPEWADQAAIAEV